MLGSFMEDIGIRWDQFEKACLDKDDAANKSGRHVRHSLFEQVVVVFEFTPQKFEACPLTVLFQVWAADDFEIFKQMMIHKNIELQLQALELLQQR